MAILYDWYENPGTNEEAPEERGLHPRPLLNGKVTMRQLYNRVHARSSLTVGDVMNAIDCLAQICGEELPRGAHRRAGLLRPHPGSHTESDPQHPEQAPETPAEKHQLPSRRQAETSDDGSQCHPQ